MEYAKITFEQILPVWEEHLWPDRVSPIETHSAMTWPYSWPDKEIDMQIFEYPASFWAAFDGERIVGVNSGHRSSEVEYRSRGIWVDPDYRGQGIAACLFDLLKNQATAEGCEMIWSIPRKTALPAYTKAGFMTVGDFLETETSDANIYAIKRL
jgi:GNAT superfamily N-acetyltransferase